MGGLLVNGRLVQAAVLDKATKALKGEGSGWSFPQGTTVEELAKRAGKPVEFFAEAPEPKESKTDVEHKPAPKRKSAKA